MAAHDNSHSPDRELEPKPDPSPPWTFTPPRTDFQVRDWLRFVAGTIAADPARYMHRPEQAARFIALADRYDDSLGVVISPATRTILATKQKDAAREEARKAILAAMHFIKAHAGIDAQAKFALGMKPAAVRRARGTVSPPDSAPIITKVLPADAAHTIAYADEAQPHSKTRPADADSIELRIIIAPIRCADPDAIPPGAAVRTERIKRNPYTIEYDRSHGGMIANIFGRWCTRSGKAGPWSVPVSMTIAVMWRPGETGN